MPKPTIYDVYNSTISSLAEQRRKREEEEQKAFEEWLKGFQAEWTAKGVSPVFAAQHPTMASLLAETKRAAAVSSTNRARTMDVIQQALARAAYSGFAQLPGGQRALEETFAKAAEGLRYNPILGRYEPIPEGQAAPPTEMPTTGIPALDVAAGLTGATASQLAQLLAAQQYAGLIGAGLARIPQLARIGELAPSLARTAGKAAATGAVKAAMRRAGGEDVGLREAAEEAAFQTGAALGGTLAGRALEKAYPAIHPLVEAPIVGAASAAGGGAAAYPFSGKPVKEYLKDMGPQMIAMAVLNTVMTAGSPSTWKPRMEFGRQAVRFRQLHQEWLAALDAGDDALANAKWRDLMEAKDAMYTAARRAKVPEDILGSRTDWTRQMEEALKRDLMRRGWKPVVEETPKARGVPVPVQADVAGVAQQQQTRPPVTQVPVTPRIAPPQPPVQQPVQPTAPPATPVAAQSAIQPGMTVYNPRGEALAVVDTSDPSLLVVRNARGTEFKIGRNVVTTAPPVPTPVAQPQEAVQAPPVAPAAPAAVPPPAPAEAPAPPVAEQKQAPVVQAGTPKTRKEPWQMTLAEYDKLHLLKSDKEPWHYYQKIYKSFENVTQSIKQEWEQRLAVQPKGGDFWERAGKAAEEVYPKLPSLPLEYYLYLPQKDLPVAPFPDLVFRSAMIDEWEAVKAGKSRTGEFWGANPGAFGGSLFDNPNRVEMVAEARAKGATKFYANREDNGARTLDEIIAVYRFNPDTGWIEPIYLKPGYPIGRLNAHEATVKQALSEGKPVPPEVLVDYPDLAAKAAKGGPERPPEPQAPAQVPARPETPASATGVQVNENEEKDGIEIRFPSKPDTNVIAQLHRLGFRWSPKQKLWYAKRTPERLAFARSLTGQQSQVPVQAAGVEASAPTPTSPQTPAAQAPSPAPTQLTPDELRIIRETALPPRVLFRGVSAEELRYIARAGKIKSSGEYNLRGEEGRTLLAPDYNTAKSYATDFAPTKYRKRFFEGGEKAYVIEIENAPELDIARNREVLGDPRSKMLDDYWATKRDIPARNIIAITELQYDKATGAVLERRLTDEEMRNLGIEYTPSPPRVEQPRVVRDESGRLFFEVLEQPGRPTGLFTTPADVVQGRVTAVYDLKRHYEQPTAMRINPKLYAQATPVPISYEEPIHPVEAPEPTKPAAPAPQAQTAPAPAVEAPKPEAQAPAAAQAPTPQGVPEKPVLPERFFVSIEGKSGPEYREVKASPVSIPGFEGYDFALHQVPDTPTPQYQVSEGHTGLSIGSSAPSPEEAIANATTVLQARGREAVDDAVAKAVREGYLSPRYTGLAANARPVVLLYGTRLEPRGEDAESAPQEPSRGIMKTEQASTEEAVPSGRAAIQAGQVGGHGAPALEGAPAQDVSRAGEEGPAAEGGVRGPGEDLGRPVRPGREGRGPVPSAGDSAGDVGAAPGRGGRPTPRGGPGPTEVRPRNLRIDEGLAQDLEPKGPKDKFRRNVAAIRLLKQIEAEGRPATPEEQAVLARYSGWGGLPQVFDEHNPDWSKEYAELRELLTEEEYRAARSSTKNAHYSSPAEIRAMWDAVLRMGFEGGRVLEPAAGVGHFLGLVPREVASRTRFTAIELDSISGRIAKLLYPESDVRVQGFEEAEIPDNFYDLAISNVPFGNYPVHDPRYEKPGMTQAIHNYFFAKALDKVRPGGVVIFITSRYTMDSQRSAAREYIANRADLLMAVRLPNTAQKGAGTEVTTDILVLRKREPGAEPSGEQWMETVKVQLGENWWDTADVNEYFQRHPEHILGKQSLAGGMYRAKEYTVEPDGRDLEEALKEAFTGLPKDALAKPEHKATEAVTPEVIAPPSDDLRHGAFGIVDGKLVQRDPDTGEIRVIEAEGKAADRLRHFVPLKNALRDYFRLQLEDAPDSAIKLARGRLNKLYDEFVEKFGPLHASANMRALEDDPDFYSLLAIEEWDATEKKARKGVAFHERTIQRPKPVEHTETAEEALAVTLAEKGHVDLDHIARLVGKTPDEVAQALSGRIFLDPDDGWQTADEYLSGDVREKLRRAETAAALDPAYRANVEALRAVQPPKKGADKIRVNLHSSWLPPDVIVQFASRVTNIPEDEIRANFSTLTGHWILETTVSPSAYPSRFSTPAMKAWHILECLVDGRKPVVWTTDKDGKRVVDVQETALARERAAEMLAEFQKWIWADAGRKARLEEIYNNTFNNLRPRQFDGSHLTFPGMSPAWKEKLRPYQKNAIWRIIQGGNTVLAHPVGAGKTAEMVAAAMELKRLGLVRKPMFVVPNHMVEQFAADFLSLYPGANILVSRAEDVREDRLAHFVARVAAGNWDAVIIRHSSFSRIPVNPAAERAFVEGIIAEIEKHLRQAREEQRAEAEGSYWRHGRKSKKDTRFIKQLEKTLERLRVRLKKIEERMDRAKLAPHFEQMGVDALFVDEAHYFKNLFYYTKLRGVKGLGDPDGAAKSFDLLMKVRHLQRLNGGRGVVFATGTPVSNSMTELYTLMRYLRPDLLKELNSEALDAWLSVFGRVETTLEAKPDGTYGFADRLAKFLNPGELLLRWRSFADVVLPDKLNIERPKLRGGKRHIVVSEASDALRAYIMRLAERLEAIRKGRVKPQEDNYLQVTNDGRLAAIDMRLVDPTAPDDPTSKVNRAVENIYNIWKETEKDRLTQVVFLDTGVPKSESRGSKKRGTKQRASEVDVEEDIEAVEQETAEEQRRRIALYNDIKAKLIERGVPEGEIAFIHDAKTDQQKQQLFEQVNAGKVRIVLGSTGKMGVGTNMQRRLIALHHLDVPWRPADLEQREGRILRPGNINPEVDIYLYVTKGSFDEYLWQLIESKARMVNQLLTVGTDDTEIEDPAGAAIVSDAAVARAIASDKPEVMEHVQVSARLQHLKAAKAAWLSEKAALAERVAWLPRHLKSLQEGLEKVRDDIANRPDTKGDAFRIVIGSKTYTSRQEADAALKEAVAKARRMQTNEVIGKIGDFRIVFDWVADVKSDTGVISLQRKGRYQVLPSIASIEGTLRHLEDVAKKDEEAIKDTREELETLRTRLSETFPQEEEIAKLELRLQELERILAGQTDAEADLDLVAAQSQTEEGAGAEEGEEILGMPDVVYPAPPPARRSGEGAPTPPVGRQHIIRYIEDAFLVPMRSGRLTKKQARGEYKARQQVVRTKVPNDLPAAFHELGHHLQGVLGLKKEDLLVCASELRPLGEELYPNADLAAKLREGVAEFVRLYISQPSDAETAAPMFRDMFEARLDPELRTKLEELRALYRTYATETAEERLAANIVKSAEPGERLLPPSKRAYNDWVDDLHVVYHAMKELTPEPIRSEWDVPIDRNIYVLARLARASARAATALLVDKMVTPELKAAGPSYRDILKPLGKRVDQFFRWMVARRIVELAGQGRPSGFDITPEEAQLIVEKYDSPEFRKAAEQYKAWRANLLEWLVHSGATSRELATKMKAMNENYVPFHRVFGEGEQGPGRGKRLVDLPQGVHRYRGSSRPIWDPIQSDIRDAFFLMDIAKRSYVAKALAELADKAEGKGWLVEKVPPPVEANKVELEQLKEALIDAGVPEEDLDAADLERMATVFAPARFARWKEKREHIFAIRRGDKVEFYQVHPELYRALEALDAQTAHWFVRLLASLSRALHVGALSTPDFALRNIAKDTGSKTLYTKGPIWMLPLDFVRGMAHILGKSDAYAEWQAAGGALASQVSLSRPELERRARWLLGNLTRKEKVVEALRLPLTLLETLVNLTDEATRVGEYLRVSKQLGGGREAKLWGAYAGREVSQDFQRVGRLGREANMMWRFFNPQIQGIDKLMREFRRDPAKILVRGALITLISLITYLLNRDKPEYKEEARWRKDLYWCYYPAPGVAIYIPKPHEQGIIFGSFVERFLEWADEKDPKAMEELAKSAFDAVSPSVLPTAMMGLWEQATNRSALSGAPIVPASEQRLEPAEQYGPYTTAAAKALGRALNISPRRIEAAVRAYTGGLGMMGLELLDILAGEAQTKKTTEELIPGVRAFVGRPLQAPPSVEEFYEELNRLDREWATYLRKLKRGEMTAPIPEGALRRGTLKASESFMKFYREERDRILRDRSIPPAEKRKMLFELQARILDEARRALGKAPLYQ